MRESAYLAKDHSLIVSERASGHQLMLVGQRIATSSSVHWRRVISTDTTALCGASEAAEFVVRFGSAFVDTFLIFVIAVRENVAEHLADTRGVCHHSRYAGRIQGHGIRLAPRAVAKGSRTRACLDRRDERSPAPAQR